MGHEHPYPQSNPLTFPSFFMELPPPLPCACNCIAIGGGPYRKDLGLVVLGDPEHMGHVHP